MSAWSDSAYRGGGPAKVRGFPRPLYPPDATQYGKKPSVDGPDVIAYKRTISRLGRWPWQQFDDAYSNRFAHGSGDAVVDSAVAGFQRAQKIDATGWLGKATFDALRYALVPVELQNGGEQGMDAIACDLIDEAFAMFGGSEPDPPPAKTVRQSAVARAATQVGIAEQPSGSNLQKYGEWYGMNGQPWCAMFATWCFELGAADVAADSPSFVRGSRYSFVPYLVGDARAARYGLKTVDDPMPGDLVCFDWAFDGTYDHVGLYEKTLDSGWFQTIEGNTSTTNNSNGGQVMRRQRDRSAQATVFVRAAEP